MVSDKIAETKAAPNNKSGQTKKPSNDRIAPLRKILDKKTTKTRKASQQKLWAKRSYQSADLLVTWGYMLGALPVYWNRKKHQMEIVKSKFEKGRWLITIWFAILIQISVIIGYLIQLISEPDPLKFITRHIFQTCLVLMDGAFVLIYLHTLWKYELFAEFINHGAQFYEQFQNKFAKKSEGIGCTIEDTISGLFKVTFFVGANWCAIGFGFMYLYRCENHFLVNVLPICENAENEKDLVHAQTVLVPALGLFQMLFFNVQFASIILYIDLFVAVILMGLYIVEQMTESSTRTIRTLSKLQTNQNWYPTFRSIHLIVIELNDCIGEFFMPIHMICLIFASSFGIFIVIRFYDHLSLVFQFILFCFFIGMILYFSVLMGRGSRFSEEAETAILSRKWAFGKSKYYRAKHRALLPPRPKVGLFFPFQRHTVLTMVETFLDITVELLVLEGV